MWYEIFKFELIYRLKRPETYLFFTFLFLFSMFGVDFIFQGADIGLMKKNAPLIIAKTMAAITGILMILVSMIMGVPVLRDYQYNTEALLFINPLTKRDYLVGRFLGSFTILLFIFTGLLFGMMLGSQMPWHKEEELLLFNATSYIQSFVVVVLPTLFFGATVFFVSGMLSKKLLVVYTQGVVLFVIFLLTKAITNEYLQGIFDPFSLTTLTQFTKEWSVAELNSIQISLQGVLLYSKLFWIGIGVIVFWYGYAKFSFSELAKGKKNKVNTSLNRSANTLYSEVSIPYHTIHHNDKSACIQLWELSKFYTLSLLKETSFWAIIISAMIILIVNSVSLGTVFGVDSYPETHFIVAELKEMSLYFFIILLLFYSGELIWKERNIKQYMLNDSTPVENATLLASKLLTLIAIYVILMLCLIVSGMLFQMVNGYYNFNLSVYFTGFFVDILPFLILYTCVAFFFQVISRNQFTGILLTLVFIIVIGSMDAFGFKHNLYKFGGKLLGTYSAMNGFGHFLKPYLWVKAYWLLFVSMLFLGSTFLVNRGTETGLWERIKMLRYQITKPKAYVGAILFILFLGVGCFIFYNTNVLNSYLNGTEQQKFRANYEKTLKFLEYIPQPKITDVQIDLELYPEKRSYSLRGSYTLKNETDRIIYEVHIQKLIASHVTLKNVNFEGGATTNNTYNGLDYTIYKLHKPLAPQDSIEMKFEQTFIPKGFADGRSSTQVVHNGTFFNNKVFPSIGYDNRYELKDPDQRAAFHLKPTQIIANIDDPKEVLNARSGGDSDGIYLDMTIGTSANQKAITSGQLIKTWTQNDRNYFHYKTKERIINYYAVVSGIYEVKNEIWTPADQEEGPVKLEIYHDKKHGYNLDRMTAGMKASLSYFSRHFTPYQYQKLAIVEFPRYREFAQSLPNMIPFSEALGFVLDINDATDVDMVFFITAHEVAHQWFAMQVEGANVQGRNFILETLSQYAALMVLKKKYSKEKVQQFLELQKEIYDNKRKKAKSEPSLALVENQDFVHYYKGALAMYRLQEQIGEDQVNLALQRFITDWRSYTGRVKQQTSRYATSNDLLQYFREVTPRDQQHLIHDLFERSGPLDENYK